MTQPNNSLTKVLLVEVVQLSKGWSCNQMCVCVKFPNQVLLQYNNTQLSCMFKKNKTIPTRHEWWDGNPRVPLQVQPHITSGEKIIQLVYFFQKKDKENLKQSVIFIQFTRIKTKTNLEEIQSHCQEKEINSE